MPADPELIQKVGKFLRDTLGNDSETVEELLDEDVVEMIISTLSTVHGVAGARKALITAFEVEPDEFPLGELDSQVLCSLIQEHTKTFLSQFLQSAKKENKEKKEFLGNEKQNQNSIIKSQSDSPPSILHDSAPKVETNIVEAYNSYQTYTHTSDSEAHKLQILNTTEGSRREALARALGGKNGQFSSGDDKNDGINNDGNIDYIQMKIKQAQQDRKPKTAADMAFGLKTTSKQLLQQELAPLEKTDIQHIETIAKFLQEEDLEEKEKKRAEIDRILKLEKEQNQNTQKSPVSNIGRERDRNYNQNSSNLISSRYLQVGADTNVTESIPIQHKVYQAVVSKGDREGYSVQLLAFPSLSVLLPRNLATTAAGQDQHRRELAEGTHIWVKMLSDYYTLYNQERNIAREHYEKQLQIMAQDDPEKLKKKKKEELVINVVLNVTMRDVEQETGQDLNPTLSSSGQINTKFSNRLGVVLGGQNQNQGQNNNAQNNQQNNLLNKKKESFSGIDQQALSRVLEAGKVMSRSEHERWAENRAKDGISSTSAGFHRDLRQRKAGNYDDSDDEALSNRNIKNDPYMIELSDDDDHVDVDLNDGEPTFLKGFGANLQSLVQEVFDSNRLTQNEDGSLTMAAKKQSDNARDRRQMKLDRMKDAVANVMADEGLENSKKQWSDPLTLAQEQSKYGNDAVVKPMLAQQQESAIQRRLLENDRLKDESKSLNKPQIVISYGRHVSASIKEQRESLPVFKLRDEFLKMISETQICIVVGETGSGKTTQMGQYLFEAGYGGRGIIGCTQPRRVAATSVAERVAEEVGCELGTLVGYSVRFDERTSPMTRIKYMTDGMLLREILMDPVLSRYSVMIIDEAHERGVNTDVLLALIKAACKNRPDLKFIVTSATLDSQKFSRYFNNCPVFSIPGRTFPVEMKYSRDQADDYFESALQTVLEIHAKEGKGDILVFLTGEEEINDAVETLTESIDTLRKKNPNIMPLDVYPIFSSLPNEIQSRIFEPTPEGRRKCVCATNIAEASVTIDGIVYVVDTGVCKVSVYDAKQGIDSLKVTPISQAQARQRAGRAGRTQGGICYRLYTEESFKTEMTPTTVPELQRCDLSSVILLLKALGINDLLGFDFIDPPASSSMILALRQLYTLGAVDDDGLLTPVGAKLAMLPVTPPLGKMLLVAADLGCVQEIATVVALVSGDELWLRPKSEQDAADRAKASLAVKNSDHATLVNVFMKWEKEGKTKEWCKKHYVATRALETASNVKLQLLRTLSNMQVDLSSCGRNWGLISRAVTAGLFMNAAKLERQQDKDAARGVLKEARTVDVYTTLTYGTTAPIHPSSALANNKPEYIVYQKMLLTTKEWLHTCTTIHPQWLIQLAPHLYAVKSDTGGAKHNKTKLVELTDKHHAPGAWRLENRAG
jgi:HrpA-like RNA helicase